MQGAARMPFLTSWLPQQASVATSFRSFYERFRSHALTGTQADPEAAKYEDGDDTYDMDPEVCACRCLN